MSRRTKWRSIIEIIIGLLKNFLKTSKERRSLDLWLCGCTNYLPPGSFSKRGFEAAQPSPGTPQPGWASKPSSARAALDRRTGNGTPHSLGPKSKTFRQESLVRYSAAQQHHSKGEGSLTMTQQLFLSHVHSQAAAARGREPRKGSVDEVPKEELTSLGF